jgi:hypothetical protein
VQFSLGAHIGIDDTGEQTMTRREYFYRHSHWRLEPIHGISLLVLIQVGLIRGILPPLRYEREKQQEAK